MDEEIKCIGCGSTLQSEDPEKSGYLPASALKKARENEDSDVYCQRCFRLRHYNEIMPVKENNDDFLALLNSIGEKENALVINVVDLFDFSNSLIPSLKRFIGKNEFVIVGNKIDLFPKNTKESKVKDWMRQEANRNGLDPKKIFLVSAAKKRNLDGLIDFLAKEGKNKDIYFVGTTNVGKSTLINAILSERSDLKDLITTSKFPGTTLDAIKIPLSDGHYLIDTPGILSKNQLASHLNGKELEMVEPKKPLKPATYQLKPGQTLFLAGLGRFDFLEGEPAGFTVYAARDLYIHRTKLSNADEFYQKHKDDLLLPPSPEDDLGEMKGQMFSPKEKSDILFGGVGFITVPKDVIVKAYTPDGIGLGIRRALI